MNTSSASSALSSTASRPKSIEETYQKLSQLEHVLLRPDTYIGSTQRTSEKLWVLDDTIAEEGASQGSSRRVVFRDVSYVPGLYKIFDEILVNAADHKQRDPTLDEIRVDVDAENNRITVYNNGSGIPVEIHSKEGCYVPELIFGHLLTSSNYDDEERKVTGGRNGFGAKLANIFSTEFIVETADGRHCFRQVFRSNMQRCEEPQIRPCSAKDNYTRVSFVPDLQRFGMNALDADTLALMEKRVHDIAGCNPGVKVYWNGSRLPIRSFRDYIKLYLAEREDTSFVYERGHERWELAVAPSDGQFQQVSFVNSIWTIKGGTHVNHIADQIVNAVLEHLSRKHKNLKVKPFQVRNHLWLFVRCLIENPAFDSQTKETLTSRPQSFGSRCELSAEFTRKLLRSDIIGNVLEFARFRQDAELKKTDGGKRQRVLGIPKLDDANKAGTRESAKCTLILTEGDSAKALAISGLSVVGRDYYGVFPLRGKLLNVREATHKQIMENTEINLLKKILGLQHGKEYDQDSVRQLRYGHVMIMTDQDHDGSHIKGLLVNFFHHFWPSLLRIPGFLLEFITPIVKATAKRGERLEEVVFFTIPEYQQWRQSQSSLRGWTIKYYKGLGTSTAAEARTYFSNLSRHQIPFVWQNHADYESIELAFSKHKVQERKDWLAAHKLGTYFDHAADTLTYANFVHKELVLFSLADNARSIPCLIDGLKPSQRKVLFACFKRKLYQEIKVAQLAGYVSEHAAYHHGEASLMATIIGLAQNFVGSNNLNLLVPAGQFGTRLSGGKDAASPRYIFTCLAPVARALFPEADDVLLEYLEEDGLSIEPKWYCPVIPLVLVNGAEGIGTGWSTNIPCHNPRDLVRILRSMLLESHGALDADDESATLVPWYRGFRGSIVAVPHHPTNYEVFGCMARSSDGRVRIRELPLRTWTQPYKEWLETLVVGNSSTSSSSSGSGSSASSAAQQTSRPFLKEVADNSTETLVDFTLHWANGAELEQADAAALFKKLHLSGSLSTANMVLFDSNGRIRRYDTIQQILVEFYQMRLELYRKRQAWIVRALERELIRLDNKVRFIMAVIENQIIIANRKRSELLDELHQRNFARLPAGNNADREQRVSEAASGDGTPDGTSSDQVGGNGVHADHPKDATGYDYLLSMPLWSLTRERVQELQRQHQEKAAELARMQATRPSELWLDDLTRLEQILDRIDSELAQDAQDAKRTRRAPRAGRGRARHAAAAAATSNRTSVDDDDDSNDDDDDNDATFVPVPTPVPGATAVRRGRRQSTRCTTAVADTRSQADDASSTCTSSSLVGIDDRESGETEVNVREHVQRVRQEAGTAGAADASALATMRIASASDRATTTRLARQGQRKNRDTGAVAPRRHPVPPPLNTFAGTAALNSSDTQRDTDATPAHSASLSTRAERSLSERLAARLRIASDTSGSAMPSVAHATGGSVTSRKDADAVSETAASYEAHWQPRSSEERSRETAKQAACSALGGAGRGAGRARRPAPRVLPSDDDDDDESSDGAVRTRRSRAGAGARLANEHDDDDDNDDSEHSVIDVDDDDDDEFIPSEDDNDDE